MESTKVQNGLHPFTIATRGLIMKALIIFLSFFFALQGKLAFGSHQNGKNLESIVTDIVEDTKKGAEIGGQIGGVPAAVTGAVPGAVFGFCASIPLAIASSFAAPFATFLSGNFLLAPLTVFIAPVYTLGMGTVGGLYAGAAVSGASGFIAGSSLGALIGLTKGTACNLAEIPPAVQNLIFSDPVQRRIKRYEEKLQKSMLALVEKKEFTEDETVSCSICHENIEDPGSAYVFRHCQCESKGLCQDCQELFLRHHLKGYDFPVNCPGGCDYPVTEVDLERLGANEQEIKRFRTNLLKSLVSGQSKLRFCPTEECLNGKIVNGSEDAAWTCDICHFKGCILCGERNIGKDHKCNQVSAEINKVLEKGRMKRDPADPSLGTIRPCYYCGKIINRIDGCNSVRCTECNKTFHWNKGNIVRHDYENGEMEYKPLKPPHF